MSSTQQAATGGEGCGPVPLEPLTLTIYHPQAAAAAGLTAAAGLGALIIQGSLTILGNATQLATVVADVMSTQFGGTPM